MKQTKRRNKQNDSGGSESHRLHARVFVLVIVTYHLLVIYIIM